MDKFGRGKEPERERVYAIVHAAFGDDIACDLVRFA
jgi:hypothetical protein